MKAKIGIMSEAFIRKRMLAIAAGKYKPEAREPKVWYASMAAVSHILNERNIELLRLIDKAKPQSLAELAELSGRHKSNLSKTLSTLSEKGFLKIEKHGNNMSKPVALYTDFEIVVDKYYEDKVIKAISGEVAA